MRIHEAVSMRTDRKIIWGAIGCIKHRGGVRNIGGAGWFKHGGVGDLCGFTGYKESEDDMDNFTLNTEY
jgi:hypothetical protein